MKVAFS